MGAIASPARRGSRGRWERRALLVGLALTLWCCERAEDGPARNPSTSPAAQLPGFVIGQVASRVGPQAEQPVEGIDPAEVGLLFRNAVRALPMFADEGAPGPVIDFTLEYGIGVGQAEPPPGAAEGSGGRSGYVIFMLAAEGGARGDPRYQFEVQGLYREPVAAGETPLEAARRLIDAGVADVVDGIRAEAAPRVADNTEVLAMLGETEGEDLLPVIREVHRRRLTEASPRLRELLGSEDLELIIAAATALGRVRDPRAVSPLIDLISREHRELTELVLPILGEIGGGEARIYLETVAAAHELPRVRRLAQEVLDSMGAGP